MDEPQSRDLPAAFAAELERTYFWWEPVESKPRSPERIVAQAMRFATFADVRRLENTLGPARLSEVMLRAQPGWFDERSWEFWRGRLTRSTGQELPDAPPRRSFDVGSV